MDGSDARGQLGSITSVISLPRADLGYLQETNEKNAIAAIEAEIEELNIMVKDLENLSKKHKQLQKRLDDIYARVFDGPSTAFPEEDHAETEVYALEKEYRDVR